MRRPLLGLVAVVACGWAWAACGGKVIGEGTSGAPGTGAPTSTITFPSPGNDTPPPNTVGPAPTKPPPDPASYSAQAWPGGLDHIDIFKADFATDTCVHVHLASPADPPLDGPFAGVKTPATWGLRSADRSAGAKDCSFNSKRPSMVQADDARGFVSWPPSGGKVFPCWLDVDLALVFPDGTTELMTRDAVNVIGGC